MRFALDLPALWCAVDSCFFLMLGWSSMMKRVRAEGRVQAAAFAVAFESLAAAPSRSRRA